MLVVLCLDFSHDDNDAQHSDSGMYGIRVCRHDEKNSRQMVMQMNLANWPGRLSIHSVNSLCAIVNLPHATVDAFENGRSLYEIAWFHEACDPMFMRITV